MKPHETQFFKKLFEDQKKNLIYSQGYINADFAVATEELKDEIDLTSYELEQSMRLRLRNREALFLKKVDEALERIQKGSFGECIDCGDEIGLKRLEVRPTATHCVHCKEAQEKSEWVHIDGHRSKSMGGKLKLA